MRTCNSCGKMHNYKYKTGTIRAICSTCNTNKYNPENKYKHAHQYCENIDGRLGYVCDTTIRDLCQLELDHKDGNPHNHSVFNFQSLCCNCHAYKGKKNGDHLTPGRKKNGRTSR